MLSSSFVQSAIVFIFLTIFFFSYVSTIEKEEYKNQLEFIVDDIFDDYHDNIKTMFPQQKKHKELSKTLIYGFIDHTENELAESTKDIEKEIDDRNKKIIHNSIFLIIGYTCLVIFILCLMYCFGNRFSLIEHFKEGMFILFFIFVVEFAFLNIIAKHYISGNANYVVKSFTSSVMNYIKNRPKDDNIAPKNIQPFYGYGYINHYGDL